MINAQSVSSTSSSNSQINSNTYLTENPDIKIVLDRDFADPSVMKVDNTYYATATNTYRHTDSGYKYFRIQNAVSSDGDNWELSDIDSLVEVPPWTRGVNYWAPFVFAHPNGNFLMYYACETSSVGDYAISVALSDNPITGFIDRSKKPIVSGKRFANIDPFVYIDHTGNVQFLWGSEFMGIHQITLTEDGLKRKKDSERHEVLPIIEHDLYERVIEGAFLHTHEEYEYIYYSGADCFGNGENRFGEYAVLAARRKKGEIKFERRSMIGKENVVFEGNHWIKNPGNNSIVEEGENEISMFCHFINRNNQYFPYLYRKLNRRPMIRVKGSYQNGWPLFKGGTFTL